MDFINSNLREDLKHHKLGNFNSSEDQFVRVCKTLNANFENMKFFQYKFNKDKEGNYNIESNNMKELIEILHFMGTSVHRKKNLILV